MHGGPDGAERRRDALKASSRAAPFPEVIDKYELLLPLGSGGMATVYLARTRKMGGFERDHALKLLHAHLRDEPSFVQDFLHEARIAARIRHPNVVPVIDIGDSPHGLYLVMDYVEGASLAGIMRLLAAKGQTLPARIATRVLCDVLGGLHAAHELRGEDDAPLGLVHRDFSPQNLLVGTDGLARLTDFGVAKAATGASTAQGLVKGKLSYMSPEQARGIPLDRRSDLWAAGVVGWEMLTGRKLFAKKEEAATLLKILTSVPASIRVHEPALPEAIDRVIARALTRDRAARFATAAEMQEALHRAAQESDRLATTNEVAEFVSRLTADVLAARREDRDRVIRLRAEMEEVLERRTTSESVSPASPAAESPEEERTSVNQESAFAPAGSSDEGAAARPGAARKRGGNGRAVAVAVGVTVVAAGVAGMVRARRAGEAGAIASTSASPIANTSPSTSTGTIASARTSTSTSTKLRVVADRPLRAVRVKAGETVVVVALEPPVRSTSVDWPEGVEEVAIEAETAQRRKATLAARRGDDELRFVFGETAPPIRRPAAPTRPLESNPYGKPNETK